MNGNIFQQLIGATFPVAGYEMHWLEPVSYTHLDVYKRQI